MFRKLFLILLFARAVAIQASHMSGGEIFWECIGPDQYRITMKIYRDCAGIAVDPAYALQVQSPCGNTSVVVTTPGGTEISQLCAIELPNSTCNGGTLPGIQEYIYTGVITLPPCDSWTISYTNIYRNAAIVNLQNPAAQRTYIRAVINTAQAPCNDSPQFTNTAIPYVCLGMAYTYSFGVFDPEADSVSYHFIPAMGLNGTPLNYVPPYTPTQPIPGITLDPATGEVNFTLNQLGNWVVNVLVQHWVDGQVVGSVMRDMQFVAYPCDNVPPDPTTGLISNVSGAATLTGPRTIDVCESGSFCFDMVINDPDPANVLTAFTNIQQNLPGATFSYSGANPITATVCWTATAGTSGFFPFIINVNDGACPIYAFQTYVYTVRVLPGLFGDLTAIDADCVNPGSLTAAVSVGTAPYSYVWSNGSTSSTITDVPGDYSVVISDAAGCVSLPIAGTIGYSPNVAVAMAGGDISTCAGMGPIQLSGAVLNATSSTWSGGSGTFSGDGPTPTYTPSTADIANGSVVLTLTASGIAPCPDGTDSLFLFFDQPFPAVTLTSTDVLCNGGATGTATASVIGTGLAFQWNDPLGQTTSTATDLAAGDYQLVITNDQGCDTTLFVTINEPASVIILDLYGNAEWCAGDGNGQASVMVTGGTAPYTYQWSNGATTQTIPVTSGSFTVTVSDQNGCQSLPGTIDLGDSDVPALVDAGDDLQACTNSTSISLNGSANAISTSWSGGSGTFNGDGPNATYSPSTADIQAGSVLLTFSGVNGGGCPAAQDQVLITFLNSLSGVTTQTSSVLCTGDDNGTATVLGAPAGATYLWNDAMTQTSSTASGLPGGTYQVLVSDALGCDTTLMVTIDEPANVIILDMSGNAEICEGDGTGIASVTVTGGTAPYSYQWSNGATSQTIQAGSGMLTVLVTDQNGCVSMPGTIFLGTSDLPPAVVAGPDQLVCSGTSSIQLNGLANALSSSWSGGMGTFLSDAPVTVYVPDSSDLAAGSVTLTLTAVNNGGCPAAQDQVLIIFQDSFQGVAITGTDVLCNGDGNGTATVTPMIAGVTYTWNDPMAQTGPIATGLSGGTYVVTMTDLLGCEMGLSVSIAEPASVIILDMGGNAELCAGDGTGSATVTASGGVPPYSYQWSNGEITQSVPAANGVLTVTVSDMNGCLSNEGSIDLGPSGTPAFADAGPDQVVCSFEAPIALVGTATDADSAYWGGGTGTFIGSGASILYQPSAYEITAGSVVLAFTATGIGACPPDVDLVTITLAPSMSGLVVAANDVVCSGTATGQAEVNGASNTAGFQWNDPAAQTTALATALSAGTYEVLVSDINGCDTTIVVTINEPSPLSIASINGAGEGCAGASDGYVSVVVTGGTMPYDHIWSTGDQGATIAAINGFYEVTVTDANGCGPVTANLVLDAGALPNEAYAGPDQVVCTTVDPVELQGSVVNASSGTWSGGSGSFLGMGLQASYVPSQTEWITGGVDLVLTTLGNTACPPAQDTVHIALSNAFLSASLNTTDVLCSGYADGSLIFSPASAGLNYAWSMLGTPSTPEVTGLSPGTYGVVVTDTLGCMMELTATIEEPTALVITMDLVTDVTCAGASDGQVGISIAGGTPDYTVIWSNGQNGAMLSNASAGDHTVQVTDAAGCNAQLTATVGSPTPIVLLAQVPDTVCVNAPVLLTAQANGGAGGYQFNWGGFGQGASVPVTFSGSQTVTVTVTDQAGCTGPVLTYDVEVLDLSAAELLTYGDTLVCPGGVAVVGAMVSGHPAGVTFSWPELGATGSGPFSVPVGNDMLLHVFVTDACGSQLNAEVVLQVGTVPSIQLPSILAQGCAPLTVNFPELGLPAGSLLQWDLGNGTTSAASSPSVNYGVGTYTVSLNVTSPGGCLNGTIGTAQIIVHGPPSIDFIASPWITDMDNGQIAFTASSQSNIQSYSWVFGDGGTASTGSPIHTYSEIGTFDVELWVTDANGCTAMVEHPVTITPVYDIVLPNAFSPNSNGGSGGAWVPGDLSNDVFYPFIRFVDEFKMRVFNRWGELVFESNDLTIGWDGYYRGQLSPQDVYVVQTYVRFVDGKEVQQLSDLTLFR